MTELLVAVADRRITGETRRDLRGRLSLVYDDRWRCLDAAYPLSPDTARGRRTRSRRDRTLAMGTAS